MPRTKLPVVRKKDCEHGLAYTPRAQEALKRLGYNLRILRKKRGLTLQEVADAVGCSRSTLAHVETCENFPSWSVYRALCEFFKAGELPLTT